MQKQVKDNINKKEGNKNITNYKIPSYIKKFVRVSNYIHKNFKNKPLRFLFFVHLCIMTAKMYGIGYNDFILLAKGLMELFVGLL